MVAWSQLVYPILLSAALVFIASSLIHMVLKWHNSDYRKLANEDEVRAAIRNGSPTPGQYIIPHCLEGGDAQSPEMQQKFVQGPNGVMYIRPNGPMSIGPFLGKWFVYILVVSAVIAYIARSTLQPGEHYLEVFQVVGVTSWLAYCWQSPIDSIWKGKPWRVTIKCMVDGLVFAGMTAGSFGWLWPK